MKKIATLAAVLALAAVPAALAQRPGSSWVGGTAERGESLSVPVRDAGMLLENVGSRVNGAGMCVDTSVETNARLLGLDEYRGFRDHYARTEPGGNTPTGLKRQLAEWGERKGFTPRYVQFYGKDPRPILALCEKNGVGCSVAYGYTPRYGGPAINHMVFCPKPGAPGKLAAVADNNTPGLSRDPSRRFEWMEFEELVRRMGTQAGRFGQAVSGPCWVVVLLEPGVPPAPWS